MAPRADASASPLATAAAGPVPTPTGSPEDARPSHRARAGNGNGPSHITLSSLTTGDPAAPRTCVIHARPMLQRLHPPHPSQVHLMTHLVTLQRLPPPPAPLVSCRRCRRHMLHCHPPVRHPSPTQHPSPAPFRGRGARCPAACPTVQPSPPPHNAPRPSQLLHACHRRQVTCCTHPPVARAKRPQLSAPRHTKAHQHTCLPSPYPPPTACGGGPCRPRRCPRVRPPAPFDYVRGVASVAPLGAPLRW